MPFAPKINYTSIDFLRLFDCRIVRFYVVFSDYILPQPITCRGPIPCVLHEICFIIYCIQQCLGNAAGAIHSEKFYPPQDSQALLNRYGYGVEGYLIFRNVWPWLLCSTEYITDFGRSSSSDSSVPWISPGPPKSVPVCNNCTTF